MSQPQGSGQGGGASVGNWQSHNDPMILTFQDLCKSCTMATPDQVTKLSQWMVSFVDDNKILMNFTPLTDSILHHGPILDTDEVPKQP